MIDKFYLFSDLNRDGKTYELEKVYTEWASTSTKIISMTDDEDAYLFSMQLMLGSMQIIPFQKFHDDYWCDFTYKKASVRDYLAGFIFCTHPQFLDFMIDYQGDLKWQKLQRERQHWSQEESQWILPTLDGFR